MLTLFRKDAKSRGNDHHEDFTGGCRRERVQSSTRTETWYGEGDRLADSDNIAMFSEILCELS